MTHSQNDQAQEESGTAQAWAGTGVSIGGGKETDRKGPNLSRWFWGTIALLLVVTLAVKLLAYWESGRHDSGNAEAQASRVERLLKTAAGKAGEVEGKIDPLLDKAYAPVYDGIPACMDFHYSLKGEWLELGAAALGDMGNGLDKYLFSGLEERLRNVSKELARDFDESYFAALDEAMAELTLETDQLEPAVKKAIDDAKSRMNTTAGIFGAGTLAGPSLKALTKVFAKELGTKLAAKVAAKTGTKWVAVASGAGAGAGVCSWAGPGAAGCAVVGAVITWIGVDLAMVKLDEYVTRDDFERDLRDLIDTQKEGTRQALEEMLDGREKAVDSDQKETVKDVSLSELKDADKLLACQAATDILAHYDSIRGNLQARSLANVAALRRGLRDQAESHLLAPWVEGMEAAIADKDLRPWVENDVILTVDLPLELREKRDIRAKLVIGEKSVYFDWTEGDPSGHFELRARPEEIILFRGSQRIKLSLVQDLGLVYRNRSFTGSAQFDASETLAEGSGLSPTPKISVPMLSDRAEEPGPQVTLELPLVGVPLADRKMPEFCTK